MISRVCRLDYSQPGKPPVDWDDPAAREKLGGEADKRPVVDRQTLESNVPGIYLAGVIVAGMRTSEVFIENGRFHGKQIAGPTKVEHEAFAYNSAMTANAVEFPWRRLC